MPEHKCIKKEEAPVKEGHIRLRSLLNFDRCENCGEKIKLSTEEISLAFKGFVPIKEEDNRNKKSLGNTPKDELSF
jgi:hypothetical protein